MERKRAREMLDALDPLDESTEVRKESGRVEGPYLVCVSEKDVAEEHALCCD